MVKDLMAGSYGDFRRNKPDSGALGNKELD
jgi:hypothetical protein